MLERLRDLRFAGVVLLGGALWTSSGGCGHDAYTAGAVCAPSERPACYSGPAGTEGVGACQAGYRECNADGEGFGPCLHEVTPAPETCATPEDDDCDGEENEEGDGCECEVGAIEPCYGGADGTEGVGLCMAGHRTCNGGTWGPCEEAVVPALEDCTNDLDEDCDGIVCAGPLWGFLAGDGGAQIVAAVGADLQGNVFAAGLFTGALNLDGPAGLVLVSEGSADVFVAKLDAKGELLWARSFGGLLDDAATALAVDQDGDVVVTGTFAENVSFGGTLLMNDGGRDAFVAKLDGLDGKVVWATKRGLEGDQDPAAIAVTAAGEIFVAGSFTGTFFCPGSPCFAGIVESAGGTDGFVMKLDANGTGLAQRAFGGSGNESARAIVVDGAGNAIAVGELAGSFMVAGETLATTSAADSDVLVVTLAGSDLAPLGARQFGDDEPQSALAATLAQGELVIAGSAAGVVHWGFATTGEAGKSHAFVVKLATDPSVAWARGFLGANALPNAVAAAPGGRVAVAGTFVAADFGTGPLSDPAGADAFLVQLGPDGATSWVKVFGGASTLDLGTAVAVAADGKVVFGGAAHSAFDFGQGPQDYAGGYDAAVACFSP